MDYFALNNMSKMTCQATDQTRRAVAIFSQSFIASFALCHIYDEEIYHILQQKDVEMLSDKCEKKTRGQNC